MKEKIDKEAQKLAELEKLKNSKSLADQAEYYRRRGIPKGTVRKLTPEEQEELGAKLGYKVDCYGRKSTGRPKGERNLVNLKKKLKHYVSENELKKVIKKLKQDALVDKKVAMFLIEQVFGKARGTVGVDGGAEGVPITMAAVLDKLEQPKRVTYTPPIIDVPKEV